MLSYKINILENGVALDRISAKEARKAYYLTSAVCFAIALYGLYGMREEGIKTESWTPFICILIGIIGSMGSLIYSLFTKKLLSRIPEQLLFNSSRGMVEIRHDASAVQRIEIPYTEVKSIGPRRISSYDSTSKRTRVRYAVTMWLHDGTAWDLLEDSILDDSYAQDFAEKIIEHAKLAIQPREKVILPSAATPNLSIIQRGDETQILWKNRFPNGTFASLFWSCMFIGIASFISVGIATTDESNWTRLVYLLKDSLTDSVKFDEFLQLVDFWFIVCGGAVSALVGMLIYKVFKVLRYWMGSPKLIVNRTTITSESLNINVRASDFDTVRFSYWVEEGVRTLDFVKVAPQREQEPVIQPSDLDFDSVPSMISKTFEIFKREAVKSIMTFDDREVDKILASIELDKISPLDVYVMKERIREKMNHGVI